MKGNEKSNAPPPLRIYKILHPALLSFVVIFPYAPPPSGFPTPPPFPITIAKSLTGNATDKDILLSGKGTNTVTRDRITYLKLESSHSTVDVVCERSSQLNTFSDGDCSCHENRHSSESGSNRTSHFGGREKIGY